jgi:hypothetical protein
MALVWQHPRGGQARVFVLGDMDEFQPDRAGAISAVAADVMPHTTGAARFPDAQMDQRARAFVLTAGSRCRRIDRTQPVQPVAD